MALKFLTPGHACFASLETLEPYYDASVRARLPELEPYKRENRREVEGMVVGRIHICWRRVRTRGC